MAQKSYLQTKFEYLESGQRNFPLRKQGASYRYLLLTTPRTGSTMVSEMLYATGVAGDPQEYLSYGYTRAWLQSRPDKIDAFRIREYLRELETRKTSPNGIFGIHVHFLQLQPFFKESERLVGFLKSFDQIICMTRADKIAQAVSWWRARTTQVWEGAAYEHMSDAERDRVRLLAYSETAIAERLYAIIQQENHYRDVLTGNAIPHVEYRYEDVVADYPGVSRRILSDLGVNGVDVDDLPKTSRQGALDDPAIAKFRQALGLTA